MTSDTPNLEQANLATVRRSFECYANGDLDTMKREILAEDVTWLIPIRSPG
jgi:uncharacterized protein